MPYWNVDKEKKKERELKRYQELRTEHSRRFKEITGLSTELSEKPPFHFITWVERTHQLFV